jgi:predicted dehydrogenase
MKKVRVAVLGYGHLGKWHCQKVAAHADVAEFVAIVEKFPAGQAAAKAAHPEVRVVADVSEVIGDIDAAVVVTPTSTHFELVSDLLNHGKHVFCEKPVCSNDTEAAGLRSLAASVDVVVQVGHSERFHEAWESLRETFRALPTPFTVRINRVAPFKGRATDVDVVQDLAIHDLDLLLYLFRQRPKTVTAHGYKIRTANWDHASIVVSLEENCEAIVTVGRNATREVRELEVVSKAGTVTVDLFANKILTAPAGVFEDGTFVREAAYPKRDHLLLEHGHFYRSIREKNPAVVTALDGFNAVHLVDCALKSLDLMASVAVKPLE